MGKGDKEQSPSKVTTATDKNGNKIQWNPKTDKWEPAK